MVSNEADLEPNILTPAGWPVDTAKKLKHAVAMKLVWADCRAAKNYEPS